MTNIRITMIPEERIKDILSVGKPIRSLDDIILDLGEIREKGEKAVNISDARKLEELGLELIRHARETLTASY